MEAIRKIEKDSLGREFKGGYTGVFKVSFDEALKIANSAYIGERCFVCKKEYRTDDDLDKTVWLGSHSFGRLACESCRKRTFLS